MWNSLMIILLASNLSVKADLKAEPSFYEHHGHHHPNGHGPHPYSYHDEHHHINSVGGYFRENQSPVSYEQQPHLANVQQQPYPVNIEHQGQIPVRQGDPNINLTSVQAQPGGYWPHGGFHHNPGYWQNGGVTYRTEPPNPSLFGPGFVNSNTATTTSATPIRNNVNTRQRTISSKMTESPPKESNLKLFQGRKTTRKKSQSLPQRKSKPTKYTMTRRKLTKSRDGDRQNVFNFSYIPEEFLDKGFPIHPTLEIVRDQHGIPIVIPVFRPIPDSYNNTRRQQNRKTQRQQENQVQQPPTQFFPGNTYNQGPFTIQLSPFSNQLNNPSSQTNGFVPRESENVTSPSLGLNVGWSPLPVGHFHSPIHPLVPYPYSHIGWGPYYYNATQNGEPTPAAPAQKTQKSTKPKPTKATATKSKDEQENVTEEKEPENTEEEEENELGEDKVTKERNKMTSNRNKNPEDDNDEYEDDKKDEEKNVKKQTQKDEEDDGGNEIDIEYDDDYDEEQEKKRKQQEKPVTTNDEDYGDTEEVSEEIPQDVLQQMIQEYNEKNQDTPIVQEGNPAQQKIVERLRKQIHSLLDMFASSSPTSIRSRAKNITADGIEWTNRLKNRYQLKTRPT